MKDEDVIEIMSESKMTTKYDAGNQTTRMTTYFDISTDKPTGKIKYIEIENKAQLERVLFALDRDAAEINWPTIETRIKAHPEHEKIYILLPH